MEFVQFHPTALRLPGVPPFLITEAVRGEGGVLRNENGHRFMPYYTPEADLAPRDVVARSIVYEMIKTGSGRVFIDATHLPRYVITTRFPQIYRFCLDRSLDITKSPIPVAPAAHYIMGGVRTNSWGETNIDGLFAVGETACTGVHGANRLASNSLLEAVVFGQRIVERTAAQAAPEKPGAASEVKVRAALPQRPTLKRVSPPGLSTLQALLWDKVSIIRNREDLNHAADILATWQARLPHPKDRPSHELNNLVTTGRLITEAALLREESRGAHFRADFPSSSPDWQCHIILMNE
jgi:L-aspartate oxidase